MGNCCNMPQPTQPIRHGFVSLLTITSNLGLNSEVIDEKNIIFYDFRGPGKNDLVQNAIFIFCGGRNAVLPTCNL